MRKKYSFELTYIIYLEFHNKRSSLKSLIHKSTTQLNFFINPRFTQARHNKLNNWHNSPNHKHRGEEKGGYRKKGWRLRFTFSQTKREQKLLPMAATNDEVRHRKMTELSFSSGATGSTSQATRSYPLPDFYSIKNFKKGHVRLSRAVLEDGIRFITVFCTAIKLILIIIIIRRRRTTTTTTLLSIKKAHQNQPFAKSPLKKIIIASL